jgi:hypothetical protein
MPQKENSGSKEKVKSLSSSTAFPTPPNVSTLFGPHLGPPAPPGPAAPPGNPPFIDASLQLSKLVDGPAPPPQNVPATIPKPHASADNGKSDSGVSEYFEPFYIEIDNSDNIFLAQGGGP